MATTIKKLPKKEQSLYNNEIVNWRYGVYENGKLILKYLRKADVEKAKKTLQKIIRPTGKK